MTNNDHEKIELSPSQEGPRLAAPEDFEPISEELEFGGACGDSKSEYRKLTRPDRDLGKSQTLTPLDEFGRRLSKS
jgi:hypothetical protein